MAVPPEDLAAHSLVESLVEEWMRDYQSFRPDGDVRGSASGLRTIDFVYGDQILEAKVVYEPSVASRPRPQASLTGSSATPHAGWQQRSRFLARSLERLSLEDRERYAEEWAADLEAITGRFARWRWRLGIWLTARRIAKPGKASADVGLSKS